MPSREDIETILKPGAGRHVRTGLWLLAAAIAVAAGWYWLASGDGTPASRYVTEPAARRDLIVAITATGTIEPTNLVAISSELSGTIRSVEVDYNDPVKVGQVLARLDTGKLEATVEHARATLTAREAAVAQAEASVSEARAAFDRNVRLQASGISSQQTYLAAEAELSRVEAALLSAKADVRVAKATLRLAEADLEKACICSPINGIVLERDVEVGQIVASSLQAPTLFSIAEDLTKMQLLVDIDEADIGQVAVGNKATFTVEAYTGRDFPAVILQLRYAPQTVDGVITYSAVLNIDNEELLLRPGMTATAEVRVAEIADALVVPNAGLRFSPPAQQESSSGGSGLLGLVFRRPNFGSSSDSEADAEGRKPIWVLRDGVPQRVMVRVGRSDGISTQILDGDVKPGDAIVTDVTTQE